MALEPLPGLNATDWYGWAGQTDMLARRPATNPVGELAPEKLSMTRASALPVAKGAEQTMADITGPGAVWSLWMALGGGGGATLDGRLRVYYDGSATPSIDIDFGTLLASHFGAEGPNHTTPHVHMQIVTVTSTGTPGDTGFLFRFPMPFGTSIRVAYYLPANSSATTAVIYWMLTYRLYDVDRADGLRLRCQGARLLDQKTTVTATQTSTRMSTTGGPGAVVWHSYVGGISATNLSWMERNFIIRVDDETTANATIQATGTEDWFDSAWYFENWKDFNSGYCSYVGTDQPAAPNQYVVGMATDFLAKWGGVPFNDSASFVMDTESGCSTGHAFSDAILYYSMA